MKRINEKSPEALSGGPGLWKFYKQKQGVRLFVYKQIIQQIACVYKHRWYDLDIRGRVASGRYEPGSQRPLIFNGGMIG